MMNGQKIYLGFCLVVAMAMAYSNYAGWYPTYGIFSGSNTSKSGGARSGGFYRYHGK